MSNGAGGSELLGRGIAGGGSIGGAGVLLLVREGAMVRPNAVLDGEPGTDFDCCCCGCEEGSVAPRRGLVDTYVPVGAGEFTRLTPLPNTVVAVPARLGRGVTVGSGARLPRCSSFSSGGVGAKTSMLAET